MLKLIKEKTGQLSFQLQSKDSIFKSHFILALIMALFFHLFAFVLFQPVKFYFISTYRFPPIIVHPSIGISTVAHSKTEENELAFPPISFTPSSAWLSPARDSLLFPTTIASNALEKLEERLWPVWYEPLSIELLEPKIQMTMSGDLANISVLSSDPLLMEKIPVGLQKQPEFLSYKVLVDMEMGEIFWHANEQNVINKELEKILLSLKFEKQLFQEPMQGTIHFTVLTKHD